jgi:putative restriction endonuclease
VTREEFLDVLARLRCAPVGRARLRAPHKPLLLLWLFGRFTSTGSTTAVYSEAEEPVSTLINDLGVLGLTTELHIRGSSLYVARGDAGRRAVDDLSGRPLLAPRPGQPAVEVNHVVWHHRQVFKGVGAEAA